MSKEEFEFFEINLNRLDVEWVNQPKLFFEYASKLADAKREVEEKKAEVEITKAELSKAIREAPENFDIVKITEALVTSTILLQKDYQEVNQELIDVRHSADILQAAVSALDHRKSALERLVSLHGQNYFSPPQASGENAKSAKDEMKRKRVKKSLKKRK